MKKYKQLSLSDLTYDLETNDNEILDKVGSRIWRKCIRFIWSENETFGTYRESLRNFVYETIENNFKF